jgi:hypothetical protein
MGTKTTLTVSMGIRAIRRWVGRVRAHAVVVVVVVSRGRACVADRVCGPGPAPLTLQRKSVGAVVRNQVATLVGLCVWLLFVENLLLGDLANLTVGRFLPGAAAAAISGQKPDTPLLAPAVALLLLALYAVATATAGSVAANRRDVA